MNKENGRLVVLGMSGGVDSSVSLMLLKKAGYDVVGVSLKYDIWSSANRDENVCCSRESFEIAKNICKEFAVRHVVIDVSEQFKESVIDYFREELKNNRTPSPCVFCNPKVKFKSLIEYADSIGAQFVATGHYARVKNQDGAFELLRAKNPDKDQTYSLSFLTQDELKRIIFPLGELSKEEVYNLAKKNDVLRVYEKIKQSQDFCFLGKDQLNEFIKMELSPESGEIVDIDGKVLGEHKGLPYYTVGQRKGIELAGGPFYVIKKNIEKNELIVSKDEDKLLSSGICLSPYNLINEIKLPLKVKAKMRSAQDLFDCELDRAENKLVLTFRKPQKSATIGQIAVFYLNDQCLGSGVIDEIIKE